ncbi:phospholipase A2 group V-like [Carettochelys insculpta]|uniref:phospholipase A2 group V-like n=1 Tax=Carettochelys insculpta TaxID=44489 RepID=UPI003EBF9F62
MKNLLVFAVLFACGAALTQGSLWELQTMIKKVTRKNAIPNYYNYGCYCGWGGAGTPKDGTDECCRMHDCCYARLEELGCNAIINTYTYFYLGGEIYCGLGSSCQKKSCQCDKEFVLCLKKHLRSYNKAYRSYPKSSCGNKKPTCRKVAQRFAVLSISPR